MHNGKKKKKSVKILYRISCNDTDMLSNNIQNSKKILAIYSRLDGKEIKKFAFFLAEASTAKIANSGVLKILMQFMRFLCMILKSEPYEQLLHAK